VLVVLPLPLDEGAGTTVAVVAVVAAQRLLVLPVLLAATAQPIRPTLFRPDLTSTRLLAVVVLPELPVVALVKLALLSYVPVVAAAHTLLVLAALAERVALVPVAAGAGEQTTITMVATVALAEQVKSLSGCTANETRTNQRRHSNQRHYVGRRITIRSWRGRHDQTLF